MSDQFRSENMSGYLDETGVASFSRPHADHGPDDHAGDVAHLLHLRAEGGDLTDDLLRFGVMSEQSSAREIATQWNLPYLEDEGLRVDAGSIARVSAEEVSRLRAVPVRSDDGGLWIVVSEASGERFAAVREHFSTEVCFGVVTRATLERLLETARTPAASPVLSEGPSPWGQSFERVLGLFDDEATRLQALRLKVQQLGAETSERLHRLRHLEAELARAQADRQRDLETIDRLRHELAERDGRLDRARTKAQELEAIIDGGGLR